MVPLKHLPRPALIAVSVMLTWAVLAPGSLAAARGRTDTRAPGRAAARKPPAAPPIPAQPARANVATTALPRAIICLRREPILILLLPLDRAEIKTSADLFRSQLGHDGVFPPRFQDHSDRESRISFA